MRLERGPHALPPIADRQPIFPTREWAEQWCVDVIEENHASMGPLVIALIDRYFGPVSGLIGLAKFPIP